MWRTTRHSFPHSQLTFLHIIVPSWQLTVSMHQIGSLICNKHDKLMVKMTILFLLYLCYTLTFMITCAINLESGCNLMLANRGFVETWFGLCQISPIRISDTIRVPSRIFSWGASCIKYCLGESGGIPFIVIRDCFWCNIWDKIIPRTVFLTRLNPDDRLGR